MAIEMLASPIMFFGRPCILACDGNCRKAWGINLRPWASLSDDPDDFAYLADDELGEAPADPGTYEGGHGKPRPHTYSDPGRHNKWCARECERGRVFDAAVVLPEGLPDFARRRRNKPVSEVEGD